MKNYLNLLHSVLNIILIIGILIFSKTCYGSPLGTSMSCPCPGVIWKRKNICIRNDENVLVIEYILFIMGYSTVERSLYFLKNVNLTEMSTFLAFENI